MSDGHYTLHSLHLLWPLPPLRFLRPLRPLRPLLPLRPLYRPIFIPLVNKQHSLRVINVCKRKLYTTLILYTHKLKINWD
jgi:hypothetical protein